MLSQLTYQEKEEIIFNTLMLKHAVHRIAALTNSGVENVLSELIKLSETSLQKLSESQINQMIAVNDEVRAAAENLSPTGVSYIVIGHDSSV